MTTLSSYIEESTANYYLAAVVRTDWSHEDCIAGAWRIRGTSSWPWHAMVVKGWMMDVMMWVSTKTKHVQSACVPSWWASEPCCRIALQHQKVINARAQIKSREMHHATAWLISYLLATERGQWVAFWKALVKLYRFGVYSASLEPNLTIDNWISQKRGYFVHSSRLSALGQLSALHPELLQSRAPK